MKSLLVVTPAEKNTALATTQPYKWDTCRGNAHILRVRGALLIAGASAKDVEQLERIPEDSVLENDNDWMAELPLAMKVERTEHVNKSTYQKLTLEDFKLRLKEGKYESAAGARRAIGKTDWEEAERETAKRLVDKAFPENVSSSKEKASKPKAVKAAATTGEPKRRGRPPKNAEGASAKTTEKKEGATQDAPKRRGRPPKAASTALTTVRAEFVKTSKTKQIARAKHASSSEQVDDLQSATALLNNISAVITAAAATEKSTLNINKDMLSTLCNNVIALGVQTTNKLLPALPQEEQSESADTYKAPLNGVSASLDAPRTTVTAADLD